LKEEFEVSPETGAQLYRGWNKRARKGNVPNGSSPTHPSRASVGLLDVPLPFNK